MILSLRLSAILSTIALAKVEAGRKALAKAEANSSSGKSGKNRFSTGYALQLGSGQAAIDTGIA